MNSRSRSRSIGTVAAAALLAASHASSVSAAPQAACSLLSLAEVRAIVGSPVVVFEPSSQGPTVRGDHTDSTCVYMPPGDVLHWAKGAGMASIFLMSGPAATLNQANDVIKKRHGVARLKGDVLAGATVSISRRVDASAGSKLLAAVLSRLH